MSKFIASSSSLSTQAAPATAPAGRPVSWVKKSLCFVLSLAMLNSLTLPMAYAYSYNRQKDALQALMQQPVPADRYALGLDTLARILSDTSGTAPAKYTARTASADTRIAGVLAQMEQEAAALRQEWQDLRTTWEQSGIAPEIFADQARLEAVFEAKHQELVRLLSAVAGGGNVQALQDFLAQESPGQTHLPINLDNMPWQVEQPKPIAPVLTDTEARARLSEEAPVLHSAQSGVKNRLIRKDQPDTPAVTYRLAAALEQENTTPQTATTKAGKQPPASLTTTVGKLAAAPAAADLAETLDAPHTAEIKALANSLGNNPHKIYQWVHDNIHYFPSHGSVQGAQDTLDKQRGNAFDTNSLLIALLRSAGIPARYVYGTVELPVAQVQNWVGGVATADAAQQLLGQGGVPNMILTKGGQDHAFRMEHVWVEAYIGYHPGRGATYSPGQQPADTWVPMDGSYKQYTYRQGMDLQSAVPFDAQALLNAAQQGAEINEAEGWVRGLNTGALQAELSRYQTRLEQHISQQNNGNSTVGDVLGQRNAQIDPLPYLAGSLPYSVKARSQPFSEIPDARRAKFKYEIYPDQRMAAWGDSPVLSWQVPTASIAGKKITLAWVAANEASQKAIEALIPTNLTDLSQLPRSIPSSVQLKPQIIVEGEVKAEGSSFSAGSEPVGAGSFTKYGSNQWDTTTDQLIAGQQTALGVSIQGISQKQLDALKSSMERTSKKLEQSQTVPQSQREHILKDMTGEHIVGDLLTATIWGYFASLQSYGVVSGSQADVIDLPGLQYGLFHSQVRPNKLWGVVTTGISFTGLNIDVGHVRGIRWVKDDNPASQINSNPDLATKTKTAAQNRWIAYNKSKGQYSSGQEHAVLEEAWIDKSQCKYTDNKGQIHNPNQPACAKGVSAVKAIAIAQAQGQKIYTITSENRATALPKLSIGGSVGAEITNAINAGKEVIFHESKININGWSGHGYIIIDPDTGAGAYIIEGSGNGGFLSFLVGFGINAFFLIAITLSLLSGPGWLLFGMLLLQIVSTSKWLDDVKDAQNEKEMNATAIMAMLDVLLQKMPTGGKVELNVIKGLLEFIVFWV